ncbi:hypothetical protein QQP08_015059 [Theobroma cacao]|nr:hypothetical protein QQP08_015059 [Theobroma cacao]
MKLKKFCTFENRTYSDSLVKEFYASIALDKNELEELKDFINDGLNVFLNGKEFVVTTTDLGNLLKIECEEGDYEISENYDFSSLWEIIIGKKEKYSSKSYASFIKSPQIRILYYFIAENIHGRNGSFSYVGLQDMWLMEHAFNVALLNFGQFMIEKMRGPYQIDKVNLPYGYIITSLVTKKRIWSSRYELDQVKSKDQAIYLGSLPKMRYKLKELESVTKEKGKSATTPAVEDTSATASPTPVEQATESPAFKPKGHESKSVQPRKSPTFELENDEKSNEGTEVLGSFDDTSPPHDEPQPEQPSPPNSEEV